MSTSGGAQPSDAGRQATDVAPVTDGRRQPPAAAAAAPKRNRRGLVLAVLAVVAAVGIVYALYARHFEETDDAQIDGNISSLGPRVAGTVTAVGVVENQLVHAGDVLLEIDTTDLAVAVAQAKAAVAQAEAQLQAEDPLVSITQTTNTAAVAGASSDLVSANAALSGAEKDVAQLSARLAEAEGNARLAEIERRRAETLFKQQAIPSADLDRRVTTAETTAQETQALRQSLAAAREKVAQQRAQIDASKSRLTEVRKNAPRQVETRRASVLFRQANLDLAKAELAQAELNLSYAKVRTPVTGMVAKKAVSVGDHVAPGQQLFAIAQTDTAPWVTANFRETQLELMRPGQDAEIHVDALARTFSGKVESLGGTTGSRLSVLPPENASGNYVKVVQRIPVRIRFDPGQPGLERLTVGMSVEPKVRIRP